VALQAFSLQRYSSGSYFGGRDYGRRRKCEHFNMMMIHDYRGLMPIEREVRSRTRMVSLDHGHANLFIFTCLIQTDISGYLPGVRVAPHEPYLVVSEDLVMRARCML